MISAFGVDHGQISKGFTANAERLASAARKGDTYASMRLAQGNQGAKVAGHLQAAKQLNAKKIRGPVARTKARSQTVQANAAKETGIATGKQTRKWVNQTSAANYANPAKGLRTSEPAKRGLTGNQIMAGSVLGGAGVGAGYAYSQRKKTVA